MSQRTKTIIIVVEVMVSVAIVFFAGYQLAVYQEENDKPLLPHFTIGTSSQNQQYQGPWSCNGGNICPDEPVIYLYPSRPEKVVVHVSYAPGFSKTEPTYDPDNGWQVIASPHGTLTNIKDGKQYPYLLWEGKPGNLIFDMSSGFVVRGSDTKAFLEKALPAMGLNQNETDTFVKYWLPRMHDNAYNLIHFAGSDYTNAVTLNIAPRPDALLRVFMAYKPLKAPVVVAPQTFSGFQRHGFTAVEWGGTELY